MVGGTNNNNKRKKEQKMKKIKIRGLVFVGFAATVFASSAMASIIPPSGMDQTANDYEETINGLKKTVTSKYYTNENLQERVKTDLAEKDGVVSEKAAYIGWSYGQNGEDSEWVKLEGKNVLAATSGGTANTAYIEIEHDATDTNNPKHYVKMNPETIATMQSEILSANDNATGVVKGRLTTANAVYNLLDREATNGTSTIDDNSTNNTVPTSKNVYDFVMNNVIDDVYQPKATNTTGAQVGVRVEGENDDPDVSTWYTLGVGQDGVAVTASGDEAYLRIERDNGNTQGHNAGVYVDLDHSKIVKGSSDAVGSGAAYNTDGIAGTNGGGAANMLVTASAVYDYAVPIDWTEKSPTGYANKTLVTDASGEVVLSDVPALPGTSAMPAGCSSPGNHCALVTNWVPSATVGEGQEQVTIPAHIELEWTVMANAVE